MKLFKREGRCRRQKKAINGGTNSDRSSSETAGEQELSA